MGRMAPCMAAPTINVYVALAASLSLLHVTALWNLSLSFFWPWGHAISLIYSFFGSGLTFVPRSHTESTHSFLCWHLVHSLSFLCELSSHISFLYLFLYIFLNKLRAFRKAVAIPLSVIRFDVRAHIPLVVHRHWRIALSKMLYNALTTANPVGGP